MAVGNAPGAMPLQRRLGMLAQSYFLVLGQDKQELEWNPPNPKNPPDWSKTQANLNKLIPGTTTTQGDLAILGNLRD